MYTSFFAFPLLIIPVVVQLILGSLSIMKKIPWKLQYISLSTSIFQIAAIFLSIQIVGDDISSRGIRCGMPVLGIGIIGISLLALLLLIALIQWFIKHLIRKK